LKLLINIMAFQVGWFVSVLAAAQKMPWIGPVAVLMVVALHLKLAKRPRAEVQLILLAMGLGLILDSLLLSTGWLRYPGGFWLAGAAPYWIITLWALFATTLNVSMRWLRGRFVLTMLFGAIGGPLSYLGGAKLGGMTLVAPASALGALAVSWALVMPLLIWLSSRLDGMREQSVPPYVTADWSVTDNA
jgi:hypothetical protein